MFANYPTSSQLSDPLLCECPHYYITFIQGCQLSNVALVFIAERNDNCNVRLIRVRVLSQVLIQVKLVKHLEK